MVELQKLEQSKPKKYRKEEVFQINDKITRNTVWIMNFYNKKSFISWISTWGRGLVGPVSYPDLYATVSCSDFIDSSIILQTLHKTLQMKASNQEKNRIKSLKIIQNHFSWKYIGDLFWLDSNCTWSHNNLHFLVSGLNLDNLSILVLRFHKTMIKFQQTLK